MNKPKYFFVGLLLLSFLAFPFLATAGPQTAGTNYNWGVDEGEEYVWEITDVTGGIDYSSYLEEYKEALENYTLGWAPDNLLKANITETGNNNIS
ncbi:MAG: hypothetical protein R6U96_10355, partial [Promethearchaeia archaeon]